MPCNVASEKPFLPGTLPEELYRGMIWHETSESEMWMGAPAEDMSMNKVVARLGYTRNGLFRFCKRYKIKQRYTRSRYR